MNQTNVILKEDTNLFKGVTNEDAFLEAQVRKHFSKERKDLEDQRIDLEKRLKDFEEKIKREKAIRTFIPKSTFLLREQLDRMENFIVTLDKLLETGDKKGLASAMRKEIDNIYGMNIYLSSDTKYDGADILYDFGVYGSTIYKKIRDTNADYNRTNKKLGEIKVRETEWFFLPNQESGDKPSRDH